ncbi:MAG: glutaredoxin [Candidatus Moranbacteria bacterium]|jgi:cytochrome c biogenesis protein CcdA|nr:glutaredoxin [Candidatus Moranbacteria bacterium]
MRNRKSIVFLFLILLGTAFSVRGVFAAGKASIEVLERQDCRHCEEEKIFLNALVSRRGDVDVRFIDIGSAEGKALFDRTTSAEGLSKSTPITAVGGTILQGFDIADTTGKRIEELVDKGIAEGGPSGFDAILSNKNAHIEADAGSTCSDGTICVTPAQEPLYVSIPFFGPKDVSGYSLPALASILGFVDGFNPCALWVLVTFLLVLIQFGDRRKIMFVAGLFLLAETIMYYLILNVWFTAWDFIGLDQIVTPLVGLIAIGGGGFFIYEWYRGDGTCLVTDVHKRAKISGQIRKLATEPFTWVTAVGVVSLALSVNVIEFACSIGIPQTFTKIIEMNQLGFLKSQGLMLLYMFFYMIDDLVVFGLAIWGAQRLQSTQAYVKWCNLFGGILMVLLGLLLIVRPDSLTF